MANSALEKLTFSFRNGRLLMGGEPVTVISKYDQRHASPVHEQRMGIRLGLA
ncbi:hypothetical protein QM565_12795 [Geitlerinema splendidum]|nr:hypothetical protein [Geitlerinema splendidum]